MKKANFPLLEFNIIFAVFGIVPDKEEGHAADSQNGGNDEEHRQGFHPVDIGLSNEVQKYQVVFEDFLFQEPVEGHSSYEEGGEQIRCQTQHQRKCETLYFLGCYPVKD